MVIVVGIGHSEQLLDEAILISHGANTFRKGMNLTILSSAIGE